jgi:2-polyprenyl-3-methyl-5-hydroxy-6-metoxy-1,4-benzoquinol methylase
MELERLRSDFDKLALLADANVGGQRYDAFILGAIPKAALRVLDIGCGTGRLARAAATERRTVLAIDLSPAMIERASAAGAAHKVRFQCGNFFALDLAPGSFDCVYSAATLHHMPIDRALTRMSALLAPGGRLIVHDLLQNTRIAQHLCTGFAFLDQAVRRFMQTGRIRASKQARDAWRQHGEGEVYLTREQVRSIAERLLPGALIRYHWLWRYTLVWDKPSDA